MKIKKDISSNIQVTTRERLLLSFDEHKNLTDLFSLLLEWNQQENVTKGQPNEKQNNQRNPNNTH